MAQGTTTTDDDDGRRPLLALPTPPPRKRSGMFPRVRHLPRMVWLLSLASFFNDMSSEAIFPLLPGFIASLGGALSFLGLIEGSADALTGFIKMLSGRLADRGPRRWLVTGGYTLPAIARAGIALALGPVHVLLARLVDRTGKGIRSAPRDAMIAEAVDRDERGRAFGLNRSMDHLGAAFGQLLAFGLVAIGLSVRHTFGVASMLGLLAPLLLLLRLRDPRTSAEPAAPVAAPAPTPAMAAPLAATQPGTLRRGFAPYLTVCVLFALGNSSDAFILVRAHELGWQNTTLPLLWFVHHLVKSVVAIPGGALSDRHSRAMVVTGGWAAYALVYVGFAFATAGWQILVLVLLYALYHGLAEGPERAIIADLAEPGARGRAYGLYYGYVGFAALPAGLGTGWIWQHWGPRWALGLNAGFAALAALSLAAIAFGGSLRRRR